MKRIIISFVFMSLFGCANDSVTQDVCLNGDCYADFYIDTNGHPGTYRDAQGVWHIKHAGLNYFTVKGNLSQLDPHYVINGVPLVTTAFDSNFFYTLGNVIWTYHAFGLADEMGRLSEILKNSYTKSLMIAIPDNAGCNMTEYDNKWRKHCNQIIHL